MSDHKQSPIYIITITSRTLAAPSSSSDPTTSPQIPSSSTPPHTPQVGVVLHLEEVEVHFGPVGEDAVMAGGCGLNSLVEAKAVVLMAGQVGISRPKYKEL